MTGFTAILPSPDTKQYFVWGLGLEMEPWARREALHEPAARRYVSPRGGVARVEYRPGLPGWIKATDLQGQRGIKTISDLR